MLCEYGCGGEAHYQMSYSKRWCCSPRFQQCPSRRDAARCKALEPTVQGKRRQTSQDRWGVPHPMKGQVGKLRCQAGVVESLGVKNPSQHPDVKERKRVKAIERYGVPNVAQAPEVLETIRATLQATYGPEGLRHPAIRAKTVMTCQERYGVNNPQQSEQVQAKRRETMVARYGVAHGMQCPAIRAKAEHTRRLLKPFTLPSGQVVYLRGYEPEAVTMLLKGGIREDQLILDPKQIPSFPYRDPVTGRERVYHPDIYVPHLNWIVEVKSSWTFCKNDEGDGSRNELYAINKAKEQAVKQHGYAFSFFILKRARAPWGSRPHSAPDESDNHE